MSISGSPKMTKVALAGVLEIVSHVQVRIHASLQHRDATQLVELR